MPPRLPDLDRSLENRGLETPLGRRAVLLAGVAAVAALAGPASAAASTETGWRFCPKCRGLFYGKGTKSVGVCPKGGKHQPLTTNTYVLTFDLPTQSNLDQNWFRCRKCRGLFADDSGETGVCPAGGTHAGLARNYALWGGATVPGMDDAWDGCAKCAGLNNWAGANTGRCPAGGGHLRLGADSRYTLFVLY